MSFFYSPAEEPDFRDSPWVDPEEPFLIVEATPVEARPLLWMVAPDEAGDFR